MTAVLWSLPSPSQEFESGPILKQPAPDRIAIAYDFENGDGHYEWEEITFVGVAGFAFTSASHCSPDQIGAYDELQAVSPSAWSSNLPDLSRDVVHFRIYFDDVGCYEVLATSFVPPAESRD